MTGKWLQPFPSQGDRGVLELHSTASEPWLDVEIVNGSHSIARVRQVDLSLGKRLEIQLRLPSKWFVYSGNALAASTSGSNCDEDGAGCTEWTPQWELTWVFPAHSRPILPGN